MKIINLTENEFKYLLDNGFLYLNNVDIYKIQTMTEINHKVAIRDQVVNVKIYPNNIHMIVGEVLYKFINRHYSSYKTYRYYLQSTEERIYDLTQYKNNLCQVDGNNILIIDLDNYKSRFML